MYIVMINAVWVNTEMDNLYLHQNSVQVLWELIQHVMALMGGFCSFLNLSKWNRGRLTK